MSELANKLRDEFLDDKEYATAYMEGQVDAHIATQIKVLRDQREWNQERLAAEAGMKQERISVLEDVDYSSWTVNTLRKLAKAFDLVLRVSFEEFGTEIARLDEFGAGKLQRISRRDDLKRSALPYLGQIRRTAGTGTQYNAVSGVNAEILGAAYTAPEITLRKSTNVSRRGTKHAS